MKKDISVYLYSVLILHFLQINLKHLKVVYLNLKVRNIYHIYWEFPGLHLDYISDEASQLKQVLLNLQFLAFFYIYISHLFDNLLYIPSMKKNVFQCQSVYLYVVFLTVCFVLFLIVSPWSFLYQFSSNFV